MAAMSAVGVIPVRYAATRFPGKALVSISGVPMVRRVFEGARQARTLRAVIVATDDERVAIRCREFGADVVCTRSDHASGTDRLAEVARSLSDDIVVNIQGDEPLIEGFVIDAAVEALRADPAAVMATVAHAAAPDSLADENRVKVEIDGEGYAVSFWRDPARSRPRPGRTVWQHVGLYAYRRRFLETFVELGPTDGERRENLEQLRVLENGFPVRCAVIDGWKSLPVDVPRDVALVEAHLRARRATVPNLPSSRAGLQPPR
jgi:3-deoxy-manno-octulosonate cytidylyltransferase (CMP-KDO synthetase)